LDALERGEERALGAAGIEGGGPVEIAALAGLGDFLAGLADGGLEAGDVFRGDVAGGEGGGAGRFPGWLEEDLARASWGFFSKLMTPVALGSHSTNQQANRPPSSCRNPPM
jgi:hypothetical protein